MKKALVIYGSARKASVSAAVCKALLKAAGEDISIKEYNAYQLSAKPCYGCGWCDKNIGCVSKDLDSFMSDFEEADFFIVATPVFNGSVPSPLKAVVDRFQRYYALRFSHNRKPPIEKPKAAALIISAGSKGEGKETIENMFRQQFTILNTKLIGTVFITSTDTTLPDEKKLNAATDTGKKLFSIDL